MLRRLPEKTCARIPQDSTPLRRPQSNLKSASGWAQSLSACSFRRRLSRAPLLRHYVSCLINRPQHAHVCEAPAEHAGHRLLNLLFVGLRILVQKRLGGHDHAIDAKAALRGLLFDKGLLQWMWLLDGAQSL